MSLVSYGAPPSFHSFGTQTFLPSSITPWQYPTSYPHMQVAYPPSLSGSYGSYFQPPPVWSAPPASYVSVPASPGSGELYFDDEDDDDLDVDFSPPRTGLVIGEVPDDETDEEYFEKWNKQRRAGRSRRRNASSRRRSSRVRCPSPPPKNEDSSKNSITLTPEQLQQLLSAVAAQRPSEPSSKLLLEEPPAPAKATLPPTTAIATTPAPSQQLVTIPPTSAAPLCVAPSPVEIVSSGTELVPYTAPYPPPEEYYPDTDPGSARPSLVRSACTALGSAIGATVQFPVNVACAAIPPLVEGYSWALGTLSSGICQLANSASGDTGWFKAIKDGAAGSVAGTGSWWSGAGAPTATRSDKWKNRLRTWTGRSKPKAPDHPVANWIGETAGSAYQSSLNMVNYAHGAATSGLSSALVRSTALATPQQTVMSNNGVSPGTLQSTTPVTPQTTAQTAPRPISPAPSSVRSTTSSKRRSWLRRKLSRSRSGSR